MIVLNKGLPFELKIPNLETKEGKTFNNVDEL